MRKIVIAGGTGALGSAIVARYYNTETEIIILSRRTQPNDKNIRYVAWDAKNLGPWTQELEESTAIINLVGKSVNCRYTEENKKEIIRSRVDSTLVIGQAIQGLAHKPAVWINAGSAAIFGNSGEEIKDEGSVTGDGFSPEVCKQWEQAFFKISISGVRQVFLRIGLVLQSGKGVLKPFANLAKTGFGGKIGSGEQYMTWIHEEDFVALIDWVIRNEVNGIIHAASPFPVKNKEFIREIRKALKVPIGLPNPAFLTRFGALFIGTEAELVLSGRRVVSKILAEKQFFFKFPQIQQALRQLL
ncbi:TIGR01777 family oxidoreductase [Adhaeribacter pallidiroseus]|uniref:Epimerase family protein n=1 Tax=Adhaeribacter pallidiroseus TaxID=2072847 RepID=A0A369QHP7_9BACT|nr:TIGR01777 family oxidoreductase [Adhaeribacter pallidiroseus]RDC64244.1 Epimerase family protein [Adhaeribacter pallidiroseus]